MKSYKDLEIYKLSKELAIRVHTVSLSFPKFEMYEEGSQIWRSSKAITISIVEGYGRKIYKADFIKYLVYALAECDETITHLEFLSETGSLENKEEFDFMFSEYQKLSKMINRFLNWVNTNWIPGIQTDKN